MVNVLSPRIPSKLPILVLYNLDPQWQAEEKEEVEEAKESQEEKKKVEEEKKALAAMKTRLESL
jgi:hypothetical protein